MAFTTTSDSYEDYAGVPLERERVLTVNGPGALLDDILVHPEEVRSTDRVQLSTTYTVDSEKLIALWRLHRGRVEPTVQFGEPSTYQLLRAAARLERTEANNALLGEMVDTLHNPLYLDQLFAAFPGMWERLQVTATPINVAFDAPTKTPRYPVAYVKTLILPGYAEKNLSRVRTVQTLRLQLNLAFNFMRYAVQHINNCPGPMQHVEIDVFNYNIAHPRRWRGEYAMRLYDAIHRRGAELRLRDSVPSDIRQDFDNATPLRRVQLAEAAVRGEEATSAGVDVGAAEHRDMGRAVAEFLLGSRPR